MKTAELGIKKLVKRKQAWYISILQNLSQIRIFRLSTLLWASARPLQSASLKLLIFIQFGSLMGRC